VRQGIPIRGAADLLDQAQAAFKLNFEKLIAAEVMIDLRVLEQRGGHDVEPCPSVSLFWDLARLASPRMRPQFSPQ
jgi:hypothetical protein